MSDKLTMPTLTILFQQRAQTAIARSQKGVAALILRDALTAGEAWSLTSTGQIPEKLGKENQNAIRRVFKGGVNPPRKVLVYCLGAEDTLEAEAAPQAEDGEEPGGTEEARPGSGAAALRWLGTQRFDYLAGPADLSEAEAAVIQEWIIQKREDDHVIFKKQTSWPRGTRRERVCRGPPGHIAASCRPLYCSGGVHQIPGILSNRRAQCPQAHKPSGKLSTPSPPSMADFNIAVPRKIVNRR